MFDRARSTVGRYNDRYFKLRVFFFPKLFSGKQVINNAQEILIPKFKAWWQNHAVKNRIIK